MRLFISALVVAGVSFVALFGGDCSAQKSVSDKEKASKIKSLQAERDKLAKRLRQLDAELAELTRPEWTLDLAKMNIPEFPASGKILGENFKVEKASLNAVALELESGKNRVIIFLQLKAGQGIEGKTFEFKADEKPGAQRPNIHLNIYSEKATKPKMQAFTSDYAMRLEFGKQQDNTIQGKLYLCLDDGGRSVVAGTFTLELK